VSPRVSAALELGRMAYGGCLLAAPALLPRRLLGERTDTKTRRVIRVLGVRHLVQGAGILALGAPARRLGTVADLIHLVSLLPIGAISGRHRLCRADAAVEATLAGLEAALGRQAARFPNRP